MSREQKTRGLKPSRPVWATWQRSYLVTLGLAFMALPAVVWTTQGATGPAWAWVLLLGLLILGLVTTAAGFLAGGERIRKWAGQASRHEASLLIMILAFPVRVLLSLWQRRKR